MNGKRGEWTRMNTDKIPKSPEIDPCNGESGAKNKKPPRFRAVA